MRNWISIFLLLFSVNSYAANTFLVLCYHDVRDDVDGVVDDDQMAVSTDNLIAQFSWLRGHGYHMISLDDVRAAKRGKKELPDKAVLLTFDDGYKSTFTHVFPLLQQFNYPAVVALVGKWLETPQGQNVHYGTKDIRPRSDFLRWEEIKIMARSGLVEFASHTYNQHKGILGNPFGNFEAAITTLRYDKASQHYESVAHFKARLSQDFKKNNALIKQKTGITLKSIVWPYGEYSRLAEELAREQGLEFSITLEDGLNTVTENTKTIKRLLMQGNPPLDDFVYMLRHPMPQEPIRVAHVDLDYIYDSDPVQQNKNLSMLLDRIKAMEINTVYLQAFSDPDGDGNADALYFPNRYLPVREDLFDRVAWQLATRSKVKVYAWLPVLSFLIPGTQSIRIHYIENGIVKPVKKGYVRLSPFDSKAQKMIEGIYQDLASHTHFGGLIFHDDAYLDNDEDMSAAAIDYARKTLGISDLSVQDLLTRKNRQWTQIKTKRLTDFTIQLVDKVRFYRPQIKTARNMYANVLLNPESQQWFAQNYQNMLRSYDYTAIMAMPYMEGAKRPQTWLTKLVTMAKKYDPPLRKTVFELQSVDWHREHPIQSEILNKQFRILLRKGAKNIGYYPDNFLNNQPKLAALRASISLGVFPFTR